MSGRGGMMSGVVDPETLYTKQNCIGITRRIPVSLQKRTDSMQEVVVLAKFTKGIYFSEAMTEVFELC
jgi:hypothetical protein